MPLYGVPDPSVKLGDLAHTMELAQLVGGKKVAVVGGTNGLGRAIARKCAALGAKVTVVGRSFQDAGVNGITFLKADLSTMTESRRVGAELPADLDMLVVTTGIIAAPKREVTREGLERDMAISYLSRMEMLKVLAPRMVAAAAKAQPARRPRVFLMGMPGSDQDANTADMLGEQSYSAMKIHSNTVAGNEALVLNGPTRHPELAWFGLNPGLVATGIRSNLTGSGIFARALEWVISSLTPTAEQYGARIVPVMFSSQLDGLTGIHFNQKPVAIKPSKCMTPARIKEIIEASEACLASAKPAAAGSAKP